MNKPIYFILLLCILCCFSTLSAAENIVVYSYYTYPPFCTSDSTGLSYDLIKILNSYSQGQYTFVLKHYPRKRIDMILEEKRKAIVLFVHWSWMNDQNRTKYLWTSSIMTDRNEVISHKDNPIQFDGTAESLHGLTLGGIHGRVYKGLMASIKNGAITRVDVNYEEQNIHKLELQRINVMTIPQSMLNYFYVKDSLHNFIYISPTPFSSYTRHILVPQHEKKLHSHLDAFVKNLNDNKEWLIIKKKYNL